MLVYYFVPFVSNRYLLFWVSNGHNSVTVQNRTRVYMDFFDHKDLGNHLLQLCPKVVKHPVYYKMIHGPYNIKAILSVNRRASNYTTLSHPLIRHHPTPHTGYDITFSVEYVSGLWIYHRHHAVKSGSTYHHFPNNDTSTWTVDILAYVSLLLTICHRSITIRTHSFLTVSNDNENNVRDKFSIKSVKMFKFRRRRA